MSTVQCFGYTWITNSQPLPPAVASPPDPDLPAYNSNMWQPQNVSVVAGALQLTVQRNSGYTWNGHAIVKDQGPNQIWAGAQATLDLSGGKQLTYGRFEVTVQPVGGWGPFVGGDTAPEQETATIFGAFTFDPQAPAPFNEMDVVEIGYQNQASAGSWINQQPGGPTNSDAHFAVQPWDAGTPGQPNWNYVHRIALSPGTGPVTFRMDWQKGEPLSFAALYGTNKTPAITWKTPASIQSSIPTPTPTLSFYLNLWPYGGPSLGQPVTFQVTDVKVPLTGS